MFAITVRFSIREGHETQFLDRVRIQARDSLAKEPGCHQFDVCHSAGASSVFLYEIYDDEPAFAAHLASAHFLAFDAETRSWVAEKVVERWTVAQHVL